MIALKSFLLLGAAEGFKHSDGPLDTSLGHDMMQNIVSYMSGFAQTNNKGSNKGKKWQQKRKVVVVGGTGLVGKAMIEQFIKDDGWTIVASKRHTTEKPAAFERTPKNKLNWVSFATPDAEGKGEDAKMTYERVEKAVFEAFKNEVQDGTLVLNTAAYRDLFGPSNAPKLVGESVAVNVWVPHALAKLCKKRGAKLMQISTNHVVKSEMRPSGMRGGLPEKQISWEGKMPPTMPQSSELPHLNLAEFKLSKEAGGVHPIMNQVILEYSQKIRSPFGPKLDNWYAWSKVMAENAVTRIMGNANVVILRIPVLISGDHSLSSDNRFDGQFVTIAEKAAILVHGGTAGENFYNNRFPLYLPVATAAIATFAQKVHDGKTRQVVYHFDGGEPSGVTRLVGLQQFLIMINADTELMSELKASANKFDTPTFDDRTLKPFPDGNLDDNLQKYNLRKNDVIYEQLNMKNFKQVVGEDVVDKAQVCSDQIVDHLFKQQTVRDGFKKLVEVIGLCFQEVKEGKKTIEECDVSPDVKNGLRPLVKQAKAKAEAEAAEKEAKKSQRRKSV